LRHFGPADWPLGARGGFCSGNVRDRVRDWAH
jgi:hypothetical protein